ncbi:MAG: DUF456 domain-containing protein [Acidimicrobiia bacterium]|nr:DUF456 domain-containing protein [Acidimicrobiia bacterium]
MGEWAATVLTGLVVAVGLVGSALPIVPGPVLILAGMALYGLLLGWDGWATVVVAIGTALVIIDTVLGIRIPARATTAGAGRRALVGGAVGGIAGFFIIPVVGLPLGWTVGVFLTELPSSDARRAWVATRTTLRSFGVAALVQFGIALVMALIWGIWAMRTLFG